ncbi:MAG: hypothetical protein F6K42_08740 [Leptolyngbya sp. SIO1D8]|nr:hypothetical protein [Leptolyngbya sp. SIO1D8]
MSRSFSFDSTKKPVASHDVIPNHRLPGQRPFVVQPRSDAKQQPTTPEQRERIARLDAGVMRSVGPQATETTKVPQQSSPLVENAPEGGRGHSQTKPKIQREITGYKDADADLEYEIKDLTEDQQNYVWVLHGQRGIPYTLEQAIQLAKETYPEEENAKKRKTLEPATDLDVTTQERRPKRRRRKANYTEDTTAFLDDDMEMEDPEFEEKNTKWLAHKNRKNAELANDLADLTEGKILLRTQEEVKAGQGGTLVPWQDLGKLLEVLQEHRGIKSRNIGQVEKEGYVLVEGQEDAGDWLMTELISHGKENEVPVMSRIGSGDTYKAVARELDDIVDEESRKQSDAKGQAVEKKALRKALGQRICELAFQTKSLHLNVFDTPAVKTRILYFVALIRLDAELRVKGEKDNYIKGFLLNSSYGHTFAEKFPTKDDYTGAALNDPNIYRGIKLDKLRETENKYPPNKI